MDKKILNGNSLQNILLILPLLLLFTNKKEFKLSIDNNHEEKVEMLNRIRPYFSENEQPILNKVQDIFDIFHKINRIKESDYSHEISSLSKNTSLSDRREKVLAEMSKFMSEENKQLAESVLKTKAGIYETKSNLDKHKETVAQGNINNTESMIRLLKSFTPILQDSHKSKIRKIEKILELLETPDDRF